MTHPLTNEICDEIQESIWTQEAIRVEVSADEYKAFYMDDLVSTRQLEHLCIRAAADWQLEQVINWIKRNGQDYFGLDVFITSDEFIAGLREVMRPQQKKDNS